eukprot:7029719-Prorocentrum_lima.AAC.1
MEVVVDSVEVGDDEGDDHEEKEDKRAAVFELSGKISSDDTLADGRTPDEVVASAEAGSSEDVVISGAVDALGEVAEAFDEASF